MGEQVGVANFAVFVHQRPLPRFLSDPKDTTGNPAFTLSHTHFAFSHAFKALQALEKLCINTRVLTHTRAHRHVVYGDQ